MLALHDVAIARGGLPLIEGLSLTVGAGQALVLRGPNGVGKTTLLRAIAGLQPILAGRIGVDPEVLAYAGHADGVKATLTVAENLGFWARVFGGGGVDRAMDRFRLTALSDRPASDLSAGQRRRLGLARLLVTGRDLWLLDEPTVSLDDQSVTLFEDALADHIGQGGAAVISSHLGIRVATQTVNLGDFRVVLSGVAP